MNYKHGLAGGRFYGIYTGILMRTNNPLRPSFKNYGGRGIKCLWKSFQEFQRDMYKSYLRHFSTHDGDTTIERIDNDSHYCKGNCKWITRKQQRQNRRDNRFITIRGKTLLLKEWAVERKLPYARVYMRITRLHWTIEESLDLVPKKRWVHTSKA